MFFLDFKSYKALFAETNNITAKGSKTKINNNINQFTTLSTLSPVILATYLSGPISAATSELISRSNTFKSIDDIESDNVCSFLDNLSLLFVELSNCFSNALLVELDVVVIILPF